MSIRARGAPVWSVIAAAALFGLASGLLKGDEAGLRGGLANLSAPWLLIGFLSGACCGSARRSAATGLVSTLVALVVFYATIVAVALSRDLGGGGVAVEFARLLFANRLYVLFGLVVGPSAGAVGYWIARRNKALIAVVAGASLTSEIAIVALVNGRRLLPSPIYFSWGVDNWTPYAIEAVLGAITVAASTTWLLRSNAPGLPRQ